MNIGELVENFELLDNWEDKYRYIIELGEKLEPLDDEFKTDDWKVQGCTSQVWLVPKKHGDKITFKADSDAMIVRGLLAIVLLIFSNNSAKDIKAVEAEDIFVKLGLKEHLTPSRRNGLFSMVEKIKRYADKL
ncbi:MAG: SufE family protein [Lactobacillaceae bacterium]|jgi:cysteine desulfuration protein SufE|nr:SufE family protein [Lactobacillaceae bacterium]